ncbi:MAG: GtrA family protein [Smithella sp.]
MPIIATIRAFIFHKYIIFKSTLREKAVIMSFLNFILCTVTNILGLVLLPFFSRFLKIDPRNLRVLLITVGAITSYFGHSRFSFVRR